VVEVGVERFQINDENHKISQVVSCAIFKTWRTKEKKRYGPIDS